jgi:pimeloyl-ACP methyl ester carboxylesterase
VRLGPVLRCLCAHVVLFSIIGVCSPTNVFAQNATIFDGTYTSTVQIGGYTHTETDVVSGNSVNSVHNFTNGTFSGSFVWTGTITPSSTDPNSGLITGQGIINNAGTRPFTLASGSVVVNSDDSADLLWAATDPKFGPIGGTAHRTATQHYFNARLTPPRNVNGTFINNLHATFSNCQPFNQTTVYPDDVTTGGISLVSGTLPLVMKGGELFPGTSFMMNYGEWVPATVSHSYSQNGTTGFEQISLSANGIVTGIGNATFETDYPGEETTTWTIDLNTGYTRYSDTKIFSYVSTGGCGDEFVFGGFTDNTSGVVTVQFSPSSSVAPAWLSVVNPYACSISTVAVCPSNPVEPSQVPASPNATGLVADGVSAVALVFQTTDLSDPVTFSVQAPGGLTSPAFSLTPYDPNYLTNPAPGTATQSLALTPNCPPTSTSCYLIALLWGPPNMPLSSGDLAAGTFHSVQLTVTATQGATQYPASVTLEPPPLLLVHGVWSSAEEAWPIDQPDSFYTWLLAGNYPHNLVSRVDYQASNFKDFRDPTTQSAFQTGLSNLLAQAADQGVSARTVDVVAHSMGALVTRYFLDQGSFRSVNYLYSMPVHRLITIGTPHNGTPLAVTLWNNKNVVLPALTTEPVIVELCAVFSSCTLGDIFSLQKKFVDTGVESLQTGLPYTSSLYRYNSIVGIAPASSTTQFWLDLLISTFLPGSTINSIIKENNDTIVPASSQTGNPLDTTSINGIVHSSLGGSDIGETRSPIVWSQALFWLMGGSGPRVQSNAVGLHANALTSSNPSQISELTGYTRVPSSNVTFSPATGSTLTINSVVNITPASSTKTITEVLLFRAVTDPTDLSLLYSIVPPFAIGFTPTRQEAADFVAFVAFSDMTYATTTLHYSVQLSGNPLALTLDGVPSASLPVGTSTVVYAQAFFVNGRVDVTRSATYQARSGTSAVFSVGSGGTITATGSGVDWLDISYSDVSASAEIFVGSCRYLLSLADRIIGNEGGAVNVQIVTQAGCSWQASGGDKWLTFTNASGTGSGTITLMAAPNITGSARTAIVSVGNQQVLLIQAPIASVTDTTPPVTAASIFPSPNGNGWNNTNVTVTFNSTDNEPNGSGVKQITIMLSGAQSQSTVVSWNTASATIAAEGVTTVTYFATDNAGNQEALKTLRVQIDKTPPAISGLPGPGKCTLWPPNHKLVQIATVSASDALSGMASFNVTASSNEPPDSNGPDIIITGAGLLPRAIQLRKERLGTGTGRIYTIVATASDLAGNTASSMTTCTVPHDRGQ